jgi:hypothetical protein
MTAILSGYMEASLKNKIPLKPKLGYTPAKGTLGICLCSTIRRMPGDCTRVASTQALRSRRVSSASKLPGPYDAKRSDRFSKPVRPVLA